MMTVMSRILLESGRILQIGAKRLVRNSRGSMGRFHAVHLVISGNYELVQRIAVNAKRRRPDTNSDTRKPVSPHWQ